MKLFLVIVSCLASSMLALAQHSVALTCTASVTPNVTYHFYRAGASSGPFSQINAGDLPSCSFTDTAVSSGATYYYFARAFDGTTESADSNHVQTVIPQGPQAPTGLTAIVK